MSRKTIDSVREHTLKEQMEREGYKLSKRIARSWPRKKGHGVVRIEMTVTVTFMPGKGFGV